MDKCKKHNILREQVDLEHGKTEWRCPKCQREQQERLNAMFQLPAKSSIQSPEARRGDDE